MLAGTWLFRNPTGCLTAGQFLRVLRLNLIPHFFPMIAVPRGFKFRIGFLEPETSNIG